MVDNDFYLGIPFALFYSCFWDSLKILFLILFAISNDLKLYLILPNYFGYLMIPFVKIDTFLRILPNDNIKS